MWVMKRFFLILQNAIFEPPVFKDNISRKINRMGGSKEELGDQCEVVFAMVSLFRWGGFECSIEFLNLGTFY
jgi:hypothetical protein